MSWPYRARAACIREHAAAATAAQLTAGCTGPDLFSVSSALADA